MGITALKGQGGVRGRSAVVWQHEPGALRCLLLCLCIICTLEWSRPCTSNQESIHNELSCCLRNVCVIEEGSHDAVNPAHAPAHAEEGQQDM